MPPQAVEDRRQLSLGPPRIELPQETQGMTCRVRNIDGSEMSDVLLVPAQELPAGGQVVVDDVEHFTIDGRGQAGEHDGLRAVVHVRERYRVGAAQMEEDTERADADPTADIVFSRTVDGAGP